MRLLISTLTILATASAITNDFLLFSRADTTCASGDTLCGSTCIPASYTCCPDLGGGCAADETCQMGDNGVYGCCPTGNQCSGDGASTFINGTTTTGTSTAVAAGASATASNGAGQRGVQAGLGLAVVLVGAVVVL